MGEPVSEQGNGVDASIPGVVVGYKREQTPEAVDAVNRTKTFENNLGDWITELRADPHVPLDPRMTAIAVTHFQLGFMALNRAVFQPESRLG
jgi:hypothetical protein